MKKLMLLWLGLILVGFLNAQSQRIFRDANVRLSQGNLRPSSPPPTLRYVSRLSYQLDGSAVEEFMIQNSRRDKGLEVVGYYCARHSLYWVHAMGTFLNLNLWYGPITVRTGINGFRIAIEAGSIQLPFPTEVPDRLDRKEGYESTDPIQNPVEVYLIQSPPPGTVDGITVTAYYFPRQNVYWLHQVGGIAGFNNWYGPFSLGQTQQDLEILVRLNKQNYSLGENIRVQVVVKNNSNYNQVLEFPSGLKGDYRINNLYRYSQDRFFTQAFTRVEVPAYSEAVLLNYTHRRRDYPLPQGRYKIVGLAETSNMGSLRSEAVDFSVAGVSFDPEDSMTKALDLITKARYVEAIILLQNLIAQNPNDAIAHYNLACAYSLSNQIQKALDSLEMSFRCGYDDFSHAWVDSDLSNIHSHPRFEALLRQYDRDRR